VRSLFIVGQMRANSLGHNQHKGSIIHVQPITATDKFIVGVARERAIGFTTEIRLIKARHASPLLGRFALRTSRFIIADLTHGSGGAYWEAGFAEGLGRPVIYTCRETEWIERKTHFDTNHLVTVTWNVGKLEHAGAQLAATIRATLPAEAKMTDE
jgi:hypothetical protein